MAFIIRKPGTGLFYCCRGYSDPYFSNLMAAWPFDSVEAAMSACRAMIDRSSEARLEVFARPSLTGLGFDESQVSDLVKGLDALAVELHAKPYDSVGVLRDAAADAHDAIEAALIKVGLGLLAGSAPDAVVS